MVCNPLQEVNTRQVGWDYHERYPHTDLRYSSSYLDQTVTTSSGGLQSTKTAA